MHNRHKGTSMAVMGGQSLWGILSRNKEGLLLILLIFYVYVHFEDNFSLSRISRIPLRSSALRAEGPGDPFQEIRLVEQHLFDLAPDDERLIRFVRYRYITSPSSEDYNINNDPGPNAGSPLTDLVLKLFYSKSNGIFIESDAGDGVVNSSTLKLEREFGWTGLLVSCKPTVLPYLISKHRRAFVAGVCLSPSDSPGKFKYPSDDPSANLYVESVPLYSILLATEILDIDFWSLDTKGSENGILKSFPFDNVRIKMIIMKKQGFNDTELKDLDKFMIRKGFIEFKHDFEFQKTYLHTTFAAKLEPIGFFG